MSAATLELSYAPAELNDHGELGCVLTAGRFAGEGAAFFNYAELRHAFLPALRAFPLSNENPPSLRGALWDGGADLDLTIAPFRTVGSLLVQVELRSNLGDTYTPIHQYVRAHFWTEHGEIARFADQFENMLNMRQPKAILLGRIDGFI